jgi:DNA anti-recombination protein RmuC
MEPVWVTILCAIILGPIVALIQMGRKENKQDHNVVANLLGRVKDDIIDLHHKIDHVDNHIDKVEDKIDNHVKSHRRKKIILVLHY